MKRMLIKILKITAALFSIAVVGIVLLYLAVISGIFGRLPNHEELQAISNEQASLIYSSDRVLIGKVFAENRTEIREVPLHLKNALVSAEDKRFYDHKGYDTRSYFRVLFKTILLGRRSAGGGSTISQQLAKNLFGRPYHGFLSMPVNKIREAIVATRMENVYNKEEILLLYLNSVPFGENTFGVEAASFRYFNKSAKSLTIEQSALLVGLLKANTAYNPRLNPGAARSRRNTVIALMADEGHISGQTADSLQQLPLGLDYTNYELDNPSGYFVYQVRQEAIAILDGLRKENGEPYDLEKDGLRIQTTLDYRLQEIALDAVRAHLSQKQPILDKELERSGARARWEDAFLKESSPLQDDSLKYRPLFSWQETGREISRLDSLWHYQKMLHAAVLMMEPGTGRIRVWVGGNHFRYLPYDLVKARRQAASSFKPFLYASALEQGYEPCDYLENHWEENENFPGWQPENYDRTEGGKVPLWFALSRSLNIPSVNLYLSLDKEMLQLQCQLFGLSVPGEEQPSLALGSESFSLYEMVTAYSAFANYGHIPEPVLIEEILDNEGNLVYKNGVLRPKKAIAREVAGTMNKMLVNAVKEGTGTAMKTVYGVDSEVAGKTGTSQNYSDAWFFAYTENMVVGTWVGAMSPAMHFLTGAHGSGSRLALPVAGRFINEMERDNGLAKTYLTGFDPAIVDSAYYHCDTLSGKNGIKKFFQDIFGEKPGQKDERGLTGSENAEPEKKKEGKFKSFFKRLFGKDDKKKDKKDE